MHIADRAQLAELVAELPPLALRLARSFWPGPLTLVLKRHPALPDVIAPARDYGSAAGCRRIRLPGP